MPKTSAPYNAPTGKKWCARHNGMRGEFLPIEDFSDERYSYCLECKREYQRAWEKENRPSTRERKPYAPAARLSKDEKKIIVHVPNDEKGRNHVRTLLNYYPENDQSI